MDKYDEIMMKKKPHFTLIVFNIHHWYTMELRENEQKVQEYVENMNADIVCFNEVVDFAEHVTTGSPLERVSKKTGYEQYFFAKSFRDFGNSIMSKFRIRSTDKCNVEVEDHQNRNVVTTSLMIGNQLVHVFCLHLDHMNERIRLAQLNIFHEKCFSKVDGSKFPVIVCGDFNAIRKDDYSRDYLSQLDENRKFRNWESSFEDVTLLMREKKFVDVWKTMNPNLVDQEVRSSRNIGTRIDYIFVNKKFIEKFEVAKCFQDVTATMSDHYPVVMEFVNKEK